MDCLNWITTIAICIYTGVTIGLLVVTYKNVKLTQDVVKLSVLGQMWSHRPDIYHPRKAKDKYRYLVSKVFPDIYEELVEIIPELKAGETIS